MKRSATIAVTLLAATATAAWAGEVVTGSLVTPDGKAIKGYPVIISGTYPSGSTQYWVTQTDEGGAFRFDAMPPGKYVVSPSNDPTVTRTFELKSDAQSTAQDVGPILVNPGSKLRAVGE
jgi:Carboxypeptidase regulatory-like domain